MSPTDYFKGAADDGPLVPKSWTLADVYADLVTLHDVAKQFNIRLPRVLRWVKYREQNNCPQPILSFGLRSNVYSMEEWVVWYDKWLVAHGTDARVQKCKPHGSGESFWNYFLTDGPAEPESDDD